jgi:hypothetical protein
VLEDFEERLSRLEEFCKPGVRKMQIICHPDYDPITLMIESSKSLGIRILLKRLAEAPPGKNLWPLLILLHETVGVSPTKPREYRQDVAKEAWIEWGKQNYYL